MRILVALLALFPMLAVAQDLGTVQIDNGTIVSLGGSNTITSDGFTVSFVGYPEPLYGGGSTYLGEADFSVAFHQQAGGDQGMYMSILSEPTALAEQGLVPVVGPFGGYLEEGGAITTPLIDITQPGAYEAPFTMSEDVNFGAPGSGTPAGYLNFVGTGEVTVQVVEIDNTPCSEQPGPCLLAIRSVDYTFAPELDPASLSGALTLLGGGLLVLRRRRSRVRIAVYPGVIPR